MYDIILDLERGSDNIYVGDNLVCTIYTLDKRTVIKGSMKHICSEIWGRTTVLANGDRVQIKSIGVDISSGLGIVCMDYFRTMGIISDAITVGNINEVLPLLN